MRRVANLLAAARDRGGIGPGVEQRHQHRRQLRPPEIIAVEPCHVLSARGGQARIHRRADAGVRPAQQTQARIGNRGYARHTVVSRTIVDNQQLEIVHRLRQDAVDRCMDEAGPIVHGYDHRNPRQTVCRFVHPVFTRPPFGAPLSTLERRWRDDVPHRRDRSNRTSRLRTRSKIS